MPRRAACAPLCRTGKKVFRNRYRLTDIRKDYTSTNEYCRLAGVEL